MSKQLKRNNDGTFGRAIEKDDANDMILEHLDLDSVMSRSIWQSKISAKIEEKIAKKRIANRSEDNEQKMNARAVTYKEHRHNAFIFSKKFIESFWNGEVKDVTGNPIADAEHLMVVLGAHTEDETSEGFDKGEPTVIVVGVNEVTEGPNKGQFASLNMVKPACEYPPCQIITSIGPDGGTVESALHSSPEELLYFQIDG